MRRQIIWLSVCTACLGLIFVKPDGGIIFIAPLILLTFPAGLGGFALFSLLDDVFGHALGWELTTKIAAKASYIGSLWCLIVATGYVQWFVLVPWVARKWDSLAARKVDE